MTYNTLAIYSWTNPFQFFYVPSITHISYILLFTYTAARAAALATALATALAATLAAATLMSKVTYHPKHRRTRRLPSAVALDAAALAYHPNDRRRHRQTSIAPVDTTAATIATTTTTAIIEVFEIDGPQKMSQITTASTSDRLRHRHHLRLRHRPPATPPAPCLFQNHSMLITC